MSMVYNVNLFPSQQWSQYTLVLKIVMFANNSLNKTKNRELVNTVLQPCIQIASIMRYMPWFLQMDPGTLVWRVVGGSVYM
eukprot:2036023-Rhodomonas_salina.1